MDFKWRGGALLTCAVAWTGLSNQGVVLHLQAVVPSIRTIESSSTVLLNPTPTVIGNVIRMDYPPFTLSYSVNGGIPASVQASLLSVTGGSVHIEAVCNRSCGLASPGVPISGGARLVTAGDQAAVIQSICGCSSTATLSISWLLDMRESPGAQTASVMLTLLDGS
ncbi:MAG: hypothetical protein ACOYKZ_05615 [Chlamydiia bacterium]